ncbi:anti-sigma-D factor RsdA [Dietzia sp. CH92]|uniref:anti-sigma-D factor RsdA n=1 Tax=Dietzia sp. CH92 TaxID=3051823 RepID=UPI0028D65F1D|nr:anti-sigma-D factor RsdA [Dietzia sp. CH92]
MNDDDVDPGRRDDAASLDVPDADHPEVDRDDALLDALGRGERPEGDDPLLALLADWRAETDAVELPALPSYEEIEVALAPNVSRLWPRRGWVSAGDHHHGRRPALWQAVTGAAAVAAVIVGGLSVAAHSAMPGDPLWGVSKTIFSDRAGDVELVNDLTEFLSAADLAAREGDRGEAERLLDEVSERLDEVTDASERVELMKRRDAIKRDLSRVTPSTVPSPEPAPAPAPAPAPGAATLVPGVPVPLPSNLIPPPPAGMPVIPLPLDGLRISTTLQIPIDTQRIQDFLAPTTGRPSGDVGQDQLDGPPSPSRTTVTQVPTPTQQPPSSPQQTPPSAPPTS